MLLRDLTNAQPGVADTRKYNSVHKRPDSKEAPGSQKNPDHWPEGLDWPRAGSTCRRSRENFT